VKLKGKVAVVTGGARGIGLSIAELFAKEGALVISADIDVPVPVAADALIERIEYRILDVASRVACKEFYDYVIDKYDTIDILVNNAGITRDSMTRKMTDEQWDKVIDVNLNGVFNLTRFIGPHMQDKMSGAIVNISSVIAESGNIGQANYSAAKAAMIGLTKTWAREFALKGAQVRVNAITPGFIMTDMLKDIPPDAMEKFAASVVLGKVGQPIDIANAALFLASSDSDFITGHVLSVNGGMRI